MKHYHIVDHPDGGYMVAALARPYIGLTKQHLRYLNAERRMERMERVAKAEAKLQKN